MIFCFIKLSFEIRILYETDRISVKKIITAFDHKPDFIK
ncbi:MAG: hypothetical protein MAG581_00933 [Deltaproteobacteria bacterium]|jgi:hypothetical protein|nr:hypothetical protein [Deltaproteobacteria bacterium]